MNSQRGFIQIPILIAIVFTAVLGGGAYVAYEVVKPSQNTSEPVATTTVVDVQTATSTDDPTKIIAKEETKETETAKSDEKDSAANSLKKQVNELTQEVSKPKVSVITLPSGAIIEIDANGNIIRTIKEAPRQTDTTPAPKTQTQANISVQISSVNIVPTITTAKIEWQTDKPTESKIFLSGGGLSSKVYNSESGLSTRHSVSVSGLKGYTDYSYEIEVFSGEITKKQVGDFQTKVPPVEPIFTLVNVVPTEATEGDMKTYLVTAKTHIPTTMIATTEIDVQCESSTLSMSHSCEISVPVNYHSLITVEVISEQGLTNRFSDVL